MKTKSFKMGHLTCKTYLKTVGVGYEVGFTQGKKILFVGNFIKSAEASYWYNFMNREIRKFGKKFKVGPTFPATWFLNFITHHITTKYCAYVTKLVTKNNRVAAQKEKAALRKYKQLNRNWMPSEKKSAIRAA